MKRVIDVLVSSAMLLVSVPFFLLVATWIKLDSRGPVLYRSERVGRGGRAFPMLKFRTMVVNADRIGGPSTSDDDPRLTRAGRRIRRFNLDELPQLLNVLKGEMSIVGPRPEVPVEVDTYTPEEKLLLTVRPGMTDYASIRFNNEGQILRGSESPHEMYREVIRPEKIRLGLEYVRTRSLLVDLKIVVLTARSVLRRGRVK